VQHRDHGRNPDPGAHQHQRAVGTGQHEVARGPLRRQQGPGFEVIVEVA
jgi:hypothetical protein